MRKLAVFVVVTLCLSLLCGGFILVEQKIIAQRTGQIYPVISVKNGEVRFFDKKIIKIK